MYIKYLPIADCTEPFRNHYEFLTWSMKHIYYKLFFLNFQILGRDASRAYVSGQFDGEGLTDDVTGLSPGDYIGLDEWITFYHKDYKYVGKLAGRYFDANGSPTDYYRQMQQWLNDARDDAQTVENEKQIFPPCNSEWSAERGQRVWCTKKSGGISRNWIGVPRRLFFPGNFYFYFFINLK